MALNCPLLGGWNDATVRFPGPTDRRLPLIAYYEYYEYPDTRHREYLPADRCALSACLSRDPWHFLGRPARHPLFLAGSPPRKQSVAPESCLSGIIVSSGSLQAPGAACLTLPIITWRGSLNPNQPHLQYHTYARTTQIECPSHIVLYLGNFIQTLTQLDSDSLG